MAERQDHYIRLVIFNVEVCPQPLVQLFLKKANADTRPGVPYSTTDTYLQYHQPTIQSMLTRKFIHVDQLPLILPNPNDPPVDLNKWDISLVTTMLQNIFNPLPPNEKRFIEDIRSVRNELLHKSGTAEIDDTEFTDKWNTLETAVICLAQCVGNDCKNEMTSSISELRTKSLPPPGPALDILKQWYNADTELHKDTKLAVAAAKGGKNILNDVVVRTTKTSGAVLKRMKTNDHILDGMKAQFKLTMNRCNKEDYSPPNEIEDMHFKFQRYHRVVITGNGNLEAARTAINDQSIQHDRCVQVNTSEDMRHVCCDDVDLVLCVNPFGKDIYDEKRAAKMAAQFDQMLENTKLSERDGRIKVILISDVTTFQEYCCVNEHELLDQVVALNKPTTEDSPIWIQDIQSTHISGRTESVLHNMIGHSKVYIDQLRGHTVNENLTRKAKDIFKQHKSVLITGPRSSGKDILAVSLISQYRPEQCLVLTNPHNWKYVKLGDISVVLIEDFAGTYEYDHSLCIQWLKVFDLIHASVKGGKLNVIITSSKVYLDRCIAELDTHPLLERSVELIDDDIGMKIIKTEVNPTVPSGSNQGNGTMIGATINESLVKYVGRYQLPLGDSNDTHKEIHSMCTVSDGTLLILSDDKLYHLDSSYKVIDTLAIDVNDDFSTVVCLNKLQAAVRTEDPDTIHIVSLHGSTVLQTEDEEEEIEEGKMRVVTSFEIDPKFYTTDMCYVDGEFFIHSYEYKIDVYSVTGTKIRTIDFRQSCIDSVWDIYDVGRIAMNENRFAVYVKVNDEYKIVCMNMDLDIIWSMTVKSSKLFIDMFINSDNKVYYTSSDNEIRQISACGQHDEVLVKYAVKSLSNRSVNVLCVDSKRRMLYATHNGHMLEKFQLC